MAEAKTLNVYQRLLQVQHETVAPREISGKFGKARSAEQILEAVKPVCYKHGLYLHTTDSISEVNGRNYVTTTARVYNVDKPQECVEARASAWENEVEVNKYGAAILDTSQVSGKTSSYAKKYALQNLFAIDDTKDADFDHADAVAPQEATPVEEPTSDVLKRAKAAINDELEAQGYTNAVAKKSFITSVLKQSVIDDLDQADLVMDALENNRTEEGASKL